MKTTICVLLLALISCCQLQAQDYVDVVKFSSNNGWLSNNLTDGLTNVHNQNLQVYYPIRANENLVWITGFTVENTNLDLLAGAGAAVERQNLLMPRLNMGVKYKHGERWKGTYLILPKIASNFQQIGMQDLQLGGLVLMDYKVSEQFKLKFGLYVSSENHGSTITPLLGLWYRSKNRKLYINGVLPIRLDINYNIVGNFSVGADLLTSVKSYDLSANNEASYIQEESIRAGAYLAYGFFDNAFIFRVRGGYDTTQYGWYNSNDIIGGQILTTPISGDNRTRLNPEFTGGFYVAGDLIYRFDLRKEKK